MFSRFGALGALLAGPSRLPDKGCFRFLLLSVSAVGVLWVLRVLRTPVFLRFRVWGGSTET